MVPKLMGLGRSLSRFELMISIILIALLMGLGIRKMLLLAAYAERRFMESTVININTALHYQAGLYQLRGKWQELADMQGMNPFILVTSEPEYEDNEPMTPDEILEAHSKLQVFSLPARYLGELDSPDINTLDSGYWYYDKVNKVLVYLVNNTEFFTSKLTNPARIRFRVTVGYRDNDNNERYDPNIDDFTGIELKNLENYQWAL